MVLPITVGVRLVGVGVAVVVLVRSVAVGITVVVPVADPETVGVAEPAGVRVVRTVIVGIGVGN